MDKVTYTIFECRCCDRSVQGTTDAKFATDHRGTWRRITNIDGPNAICPCCVVKLDCLESLIEDGYDHAAISIKD